MDFNQFNALSRMAQMGGAGAPAMGGARQGMANPGNQQQAAQSFQQLGQFLGQGLNEVFTPQDQMQMQKDLVGMAESPMGQMAQEYIKQMIMGMGGAAKADGAQTPGMGAGAQAGIPGPDQLNDSQIRDFIMKGIMRGG